jgi:hypothetical protein
MALTATPARRRLVMIVLLLFAALGGVIRKFAPQPSTLHDVGTLLLVLWLPAVGNLIAYLVRRMPRRAPRAPTLPRGAFPAGSAFVAHLQAQLDPVDAAPAPPTIDASADCLLLVGGQGFTARLALPVASALSAPQPQAIELLRPSAALPHLAPGTAFHLLVGSTAVARGCVKETSAPAAAPAPLR